MKKNLYVIFDCKNHSYGEVMSMENDEEAKRSFILSLVSLPDVLSDDLCLYRLGKIDLFYDTLLGTSEPVKQAPYIGLCDGDSVSGILVCTSRDVEEDVKRYRIRNMELNEISKSIHVDYSGKNFVENVEKLSRYFSKKDKRFGK